MAVESIKHRGLGGMPPGRATDNLFFLLVAIRDDIELLRALLATHVHGGVTAGAANTAVPTVVLAATALNLQS